MSGGKGPVETDETLAARAAHAETLSPPQPSSVRPIVPVTLAGHAPAEPVEAVKDPEVAHRYKMIGEVGRGGLGRVLRARDLHLDRQVAVKELLAPTADSQRRFLREAMITARLQHPAIVPVYDVGESRDRSPFYAMKLVSGESLADVLAATTSFHQRLALLGAVIAVVDAMAYAHSERIIHRDLKPQNVLVGDFAETVVIDWGLAKDLNVVEADSAGPYRSVTSSSETMDGAVLGTPAYMPPEQAVGEDVDERADVYALGAMLYHVLAGAPPHDGKTVEALLARVITGSVVPLAEREPRVPADLAAIVGKAMARERDARYPTARELSDDLHKFQTGQLVGAHRYTRGERVQRWLRKHRGMVVVGAIAVAILVGYGAWSVKQIMDERGNAQAQASRAVAAKQEAERERDSAITQSLVSRARQYASTGHSAEEMAVLRVLARPEAGAASRQLAVDSGLHWKAHQRLAMALGTEVGVAYRSADGTRFIATEAAGARGTMTLAQWDAVTGKELARVPIVATSPAASFGAVVAISPTGRYAVIASCAKPGDGCGTFILGNLTIKLKPDTVLTLQELATRRTLATWSSELVAGTLAFSPDDTAIAIRRPGPPDRIELFDARGARYGELPTSCGGPMALAPGGTVFAIACPDRIQLARASGAALPPIISGERLGVLHFASPDQLLGIGNDVHLWDITRGLARGRGTFPAHDDDPMLDDVRSDLTWTPIRPPAGTRSGRPRMTNGVRLRMGAVTVKVDATGILAPPARLVPDGLFATYATASWGVLALHGETARIAMTDELVPSQPNDRCLPRVGEEQHATTVLEGGARLLIDEQELPAGIEYAPKEGYLKSTISELPERQVRPLRAAETPTCLVWGLTATGAHERAAAVELESVASADGRGGIVISGRHDAFRIARDGTRTPLPTTGKSAASPAGTHLVSLDAHGGDVVIADVAGAAKRRWTVPIERALRDEPQWAALDVAQLETDREPYLVPVDPALPIRTRPADLATDPRSTFGVRVVGTEVVERVRDGVVTARHLVPGLDAMTPPAPPDDSGRVLVVRDGKHVVIAPGGNQVTLQRGSRDPTVVSSRDLELAGEHLVLRASPTSVVWRLADGQRLAIPNDTQALAITDDEVWWIEGIRQPRLVRMPFGGKPERRTLAVASLPFHHAIDELVMSPDRTRATLKYSITEGELAAYATWEVATGTLLWVGPRTTQLVDDWVIVGTRAYIPVFDVDAILADTGTRTNFRVCRSDLRAVPVSPPPTADSYWAPEQACR
ncbi:MAG: serine/threonine-protein kinase [Kofleriaceae bacterium]